MKQTITVLDGVVSVVISVAAVASAATQAKLQPKLGTSAHPMRGDCTAA